MNVNLTFGQPPAARREAFSHLRALGVDVGRADTFWAAAEPNPPAHGRHRFDWSATDARAGELAAAGIRWLPIVDYSAPWAAPARGGDKSAPDPSRYAEFAAALTRRYGPGGDFWNEHPRLPALPVHAYEIWNEPDLNVFWSPAPDARAYAALYERARSAIRAVDPRAVVVTGGLFPDGAPDFIAAVLSARPALRGEIDAVGYHAYGPTARAALDRLSAFVRRLRVLGLGDKPVWLTELGWPIAGTGAVNERSRTLDYRDLLDATAGPDCPIALWAPFTWMDSAPPDPSDNRVFAIRTARTDLPPVAVYADFIRSFERRRGAPARGCADRGASR